jgi:hypothetical protein
VYRRCIALTSPPELASSMIANRPGLACGYVQRKSKKNELDVFVLQGVEIAQCLLRAEYVSRAICLPRPRRRQAAMTFQPRLPALPHFTSTALAIHITRDTVQQLAIFRGTLNNVTRNSICRYQIPGTPAPGRLFRAIFLACIDARSGSISINTTPFLILHLQLHY